MQRAMVDRWANKRHLTLPDHAAADVIQTESVESPAQHRLQIDKGRFNDESTIQHTAMSTVGVALGGMLASAVIKVARSILPFQARSSCTGN